MAGFKFYHYDPSFAAAVVFALLFCIATLRHIQLLSKNKTWYFFPFIIGCLFESGGYITRAVSARQTPDWTLMPYVIQSLLTLLGPTLFAASIYMILGRLIRFLEADAYSMIRPRWLTKFFLLGDILSFFGQGGGGGILATAKTESSQSLGNKVILLGLAIQVIFFGLFIIVTLVVHIRINKGPSPKSLATPAPWQKLLWVLYLTSFLIMIRSIFRMVEYAQGSDGSLLQNETYAYVLDALLMFIVTACFVFFHPSKVLNKESITREDAGFQGSGDEYLMSKGNGFARI
ncbi:RTA1 like protein-domain-containing protein [Hypoxylon rubiginosum]|uniref:RTA1 like protein-domain-containing protein n=1 Tax=Hypoxylon rubiginosum TaxID=110542 RepID=A0ACB9YK43_9PEZI|nr:RTA1 like protein-domain-containing protein [Hypoxylon rubiginosum]